MLKNCEKATVDNDSLFTNIPLDKTIDLYVDRFYNDNENTPKIFKDVFRNLFGSFFMLKNKFYKPMDVWLWDLHWIRL